MGMTRDATAADQPCDEAAGLTASGLENATPELREKLARQLKKISPVHVERPGEANRDVDMRRDPTEEIYVADLDTPPDSGDDGESDADSEPLEYAMLDVASKLSPSQASQILGKVRRQHDRQMRLRQELRERSSDLAISREGAARLAQQQAERDAEAEADADGASDGETGGEVPGLPSVVEEVVAAEPDEAPLSGAAATENDADTECLQAAPEHASEAKEDVAPASAEAAQRRGGSRCWLLLAVLVAAIGVMLALPDGHPLRELLPWFVGTDDHASDCVMAAVAPGDVSDSAELEERLCGARELARVRRAWLGAVARVLVGAIAAAALLVLSIAVQCWQRILGMVVAVSAGAILFVLAVVVMDKQV